MGISYVIQQKGDEQYVPEWIWATFILYSFYQTVHCFLGCIQGWVQQHRQSLPFLGPTHSCYLPASGVLHCPQTLQLCFILVKSSSARGWLPVWCSPHSPQLLLSLESIDLEFLEIIENFVFNLRNWTLSLDSETWEREAWTYPCWRTPCQEAGLSIAHTCAMGSPLMSLSPLPLTLCRLWRWLSWPALYERSLLKFMFGFGDCICWCVHFADKVVPTSFPYRITCK